MDNGIRDKKNIKNIILLNIATSSWGVYTHRFFNVKMWLVYRAGNRSGSPNGFFNRLTMVRIGAVNFC